MTDDELRLWFHVDGVFLCAPAKCGGTALYRAMLKIGPEVPDRDVFSTAQNLTEFRTPDGVSRPAFLAVRDPIERFMSLWRDKCRDGDPNLPALRGLSPSELMTKIECNWYGDAHWAPQSYHYRQGVTCVPYQQMLHWFGNKNAPVVNYTVRHSDDPKAPATRILRHYWHDAELVYR